jgi:serine/threonine protein kinase
MPLEKSTRVGPYEILPAIGAGGIGEIYRARDAKLGRDVALKVLPEVFARDTERIRSGPIPIEETLRIAKQITEALE